MTRARWTPRLREYPIAESNRSLHAENVAYSPIYEWGSDEAGAQNRTEVDLFTGQVHNRFATPAKLRRQDLNLDKHVNSVPCYHYTTSEWNTALPHIRNGLKQD